MTAKLDQLQAALEAALGPKISKLVRDRGEITVHVKAADYPAVALQLRDDIRRAQTVMAERHHAVEPQISGFIDQFLLEFSRVAASLSIFAGQHHFRGLFANFLQKRIGRFGQQASDVARLRIAAFALIEHIGELLKSVL